MPVPAGVAVRFIAKRALRTAAKRSVRRAIDLRRRGGRVEEVGVSVGGFSASFGVPPTIDSPGDLPL